MEEPTEPKPATFNEGTDPRETVRLLLKEHGFNVGEPEVVEIEEDEVDIPELDLPLPTQTSPLTEEQIQRNAERKYHRYLLFNPSTQSVY